MKLTNIASLDPVITGSGRKGLSGASAADKAMWQEMQTDWERFAIESSSALAALFEERQLPLTNGEEDGVDLYLGVNKAVITTSRVGQSFFRRAVLSAYDYKCCITGLALPRLLVASHIVPWSVDANNRLNPSNGLALSALHDKAFDLGIITINDDMTVRVASSQSARNDAFFQSALQRYEGKMITIPSKFTPAERFLKYHREHVFKE
jgi:putative restriction endonuclease